MVGRLLSFWEGLFSGAMLVYRRVTKPAAKGGLRLGKSDTPPIPLPTVMIQ